MKKILALITILACVGLLAGCMCNSKKTEEATNNASDVSTENGETKNQQAKTDKNGAIIITTNPSTKTPKATEKKTAPQKDGNKKTKAKGGKINGSWTYEGGVFVYTFNKDGSGVFTTGSSAKHFTYKTKDNKVMISYKDGEKVTMPYTVEGKTLYLQDKNGDNMPYFKNNPKKK